MRYTSVTLANALDKALKATGETTGGLHGEVRIDGSGTGDAFTFGHLAGEKLAEAVTR